MQSEIKWYSVNEVRSALESEAVLVIDARELEVYSGWTIKESEPGGHIPGAWDNHILLEDGIKEKEIVLYGSDRSILEKQYEDLMGKGFKKVGLFLLKEWFAQQDVPWEKYPNYQLYVPAEIVKNMMEGVYPEEIPKKKKLLLISVGWGDEEDAGYMDKHVPNAVHMNSDEFEPPRVYVSDIIEWRLATDEELSKLFQKYGIDEETVVVIIGEAPSVASRLALICYYMGVDGAYVMSRGQEGWQAAGYAFSKEKVFPGKPTEHILTPKRKNFILTVDDVKMMIDNPEYEWVDIRAWNEYIGTNPGYTYHSIAGTLPKAKFGCVETDEEDALYAYNEQDIPMCAYRNRDMTMKNPKLIRELWRSNGINLNKKLVFFCGSGWRAAEVLWDAYVMGIEDAALFSDGWIAWSNEGNPYVVLK